MYKIANRLQSRDKVLTGLVIEEIRKVSPHWLFLFPLYFLLTT